MLLSLGARLSLKIIEHKADGDYGHRVYRLSRQPVQEF